MTKDFDLAHIEELLDRLEQAVMEDEVARRATRETILDAFNTLLEKAWMYDDLCR